MKAPLLDSVQRASHPLRFSGSICEFREFLASLMHSYPADYSVQLFAFPRSLYVSKEIAK